MKKSIIVTIDKFSFQLTDEAYTLLSKYLEVVKSKLENEIAEEVIKDIEYRIADILLKKEQSIYNDTDIKEVIEEIGYPEEDVQMEEGNTTEKTTIKKGKDKKLFRDEQDKILGGVCAGIAAYLNLDPIFVRGFFLLIFFTFGSGLFLYLILYFLMPPAKNAVDILHMKGEDTNLDAIKKKVKELSDEVRDIDTNKLKNQVQGLFNFFVDSIVRLTSMLTSIAKGILGIIAIFLSVTFLLVSIFIFLKPSLVVLESNHSIEIELMYQTVVGIAIFFFGLSLLFYTVFGAMFSKAKVAYLGLFACVVLLVGIAFSANEIQDILNKNIRHFAITNNGIELNVYGNLVLDMGSFDKEKEMFVLDNQSIALKEVSIAGTDVQNKFILQTFYFNMDSLVKESHEIRDYSNGIRINEKSSGLIKDSMDSVELSIKLTIPLNNPFRLNQTLFETLKAKGFVSNSSVFKNNSLYFYDGNEIKESTRINKGFSWNKGELKIDN